MIRQIALILAFIALVTMIDAAPGGKKLVSRASLPSCRSYTEKFTSNTKIVEYTKYNGKPTSANWVDLSGNTKTWKLGSNGLQLNLLKPSKSSIKKDEDGKYNQYLGQGPTLNSTYQIQYGSFEAEVKVAAPGGAVTALITMSKGGDEIDYEWVGTEAHNVQSNYFYRAQAVYGVNGGTHKVGGSSVSSAFHKYKIDWTPDAITWYVDGKKVRTLTKKSTLKNGVYKYPSQASYIQIGLWDGSGSGGTAEWAHGPIDWAKAGSTISAYIKSIKITCNPKYNKVV